MGADFRDCLRLGENSTHEALDLQDPVAPKATAGRWDPEAVLVGAHEALSLLLAERRPEARLAPFRGHQLPRQDELLRGQPQLADASLAGLLKGTKAVKLLTAEIPGRQNGFLLILTEFVLMQARGQQFH